MEEWGDKELRTGPGARPARPTLRPARWTQRALAGAGGQKAPGARTPLGLAKRRTKKPTVGAREGAEPAASPQHHPKPAAGVGQPLTWGRSGEARGTARHGAARRSAGCGSWPAAWEAVRSEVYLSQGSSKHQMAETSGGAASQPDQSLRGSVGRASCAPWGGGAPTAAHPGEGVRSSGLSTQRGAAGLGRPPPKGRRCPGSQFWGGSHGLAWREGKNKSPGPRRSP